MDFLRKVFLHSPGHYIAAVILAVAMGVFRYSTLSAEVATRFAMYEVFSVSGWVTILVGGLMTVTYLGAFDIFSYTFSGGWLSTNRKYKDYADYSQKTAQRRAAGKWYFVPYYVVGAAVALVSVLFS